MGEWNVPWCINATIEEIKANLSGKEHNSRTS